MDQAQGFSRIRDRIDIITSVLLQYHMPTSHNDQNTTTREEEVGDAIRVRETTMEQTNSKKVRAAKEKERKLVANV